jgi:phenylacetate-CoA ligase
LGSTLQDTWRDGWSFGAYDPWQAANVAWSIWSDGNANATTIAQRRHSRLEALLEAARQSPLYRRLHGRAGSRVAAGTQALAALPAVTRKTLMAGFDDWCTDRAVTLRAATAFAADPKCVGQPFLGRYALWTSSGTTGTPGIYVQDARALAVYDALETQRFRGLRDPASVAEAMARLTRAPWNGGERFAMVGATGGHFAGNASVERMRRMNPWSEDRMRVISIMQPLEQIVAELNAFRPDRIATYPTAAELLAAEQDAGRLQLALEEIWTGGEQLSEPTRCRLEQSFGCRLRNGYGASEFMAIGWDCGHGALHLNADWVVLEPVDAQYRPVPPGTPSHTVLLTNLANHVQPLIRYDLGDTVTMLPCCPCGSPFPAMHVEGRCDDVLEFPKEDGRTVTVLPLALVTLMEDDAGLHDFQLVQTGPRRLGLRLGGPPQDGNGAAKDGDRERSVRITAARRLAHRVLNHYLASHGVRGVRICDDPTPPARNAASGKLRRVVRSITPGRGHGAGLPLH